MKKVAFVTYNAMGYNLANGWHKGGDDRQALVLQKTKGIERPNCNYTDPAFAPYRHEQTALLWAELEKSLPELDHIVVYVGSFGSENAVRLAAQLPASKVTFVGCSCNRSAKQWLAKCVGLGDSEWIDCECYGVYTMTDLYDNFMETGEFRQTRTGGAPAADDQPAS